MATRFPQVYYIRNNAGTYEAWQDDEAAATYSGAALVADVLNSIETANPTGGFAVLFGAGTFDMGTDNWTLNGVDDVMIAGVGMDATLVQNSTTAAADSEPFSFTNSNFVTVRDLAINAGGTARPTSDALDFDGGSSILVDSVHVVASRGDGIVFDGKDNPVVNPSARNTVRNCLIEGVTESGIQFLGATGGIAHGNRVISPAKAGIKANRAATQNVITEQIRVIGNYITGAGEDGIQIYESHDCLVALNTVLNGSRDGIRVDTFSSGTRTSDDNILLANRCAGNAGDGVAVMDEWCNRTLVVANNLNGNTGSAVADAGTQTRIRDNSGAVDNSVVQVAAATTLVADDPRSVVNVDTSAGTVAVTLPANADANGRSFIVRRDGANAVTVSAAGVDTIGGAASKSLDDDGAAIGVSSVGGGDWLIVSTTGTVT